MSQVVGPLGPDFRFNSCFDGDLFRVLGCGLVDCLDFGCAGACSDSDVGGFGFDCVVQSDRPCWTACCRDAAVKDFVSLSSLGFFPFLVAVNTAGRRGLPALGREALFVFREPPCKWGISPFGSPRLGRLAWRFTRRGSLSCFSQRSRFLPWGLIAKCLSTLPPLFSTSAPGGCRWHGTSFVRCPFRCVLGPGPWALEPEPFALGISGPIFRVVCEHHSSPDVACVARRRGGGLFNI